MSEQNKIEQIKSEHQIAEELFRRQPKMKDVFNPTHDWIGYLLVEIERKDEALRFYADGRNYQWGYPEEEVMLDAGNRAREAL